MIAKNIDYDILTDLHVLSLQCLVYCLGFPERDM
jgi:hypothetical protein